jgi:UDP-perosamine 4-acetyltransferase
MKNEKIIVIGGGGHARVIITILKKLNEYDIIGYSDFSDNGTIEGINYIGSDEYVIENYADTDINLVMGLGTIKPDPSRLDLLTDFTKNGFKFPPIVSPGAMNNSSNSVGPGSVIFDGVVVNSGSTIGTAVILNTNSTIEHDCHIADNVHISPGATLSGNVTIGKNAMIGAGSTIIQGVSIGENILIGAGSLVLNDLYQAGTYFGIPAKKAD